MLVSRRKRYLSGSDWVLATFDHLLKRTSCTGNIFQLVLMLGTPLEEAALREGLNRFLKRFPVLQGRVARDWKCTPYWKIPAAFQGEVSLQVSQLPDLSDSRALLPLLVREGDRALSGEREHLSFHLVSDGVRSALSMTCDHRLFDARGAELFLNLFQQSLNEPAPPAEPPFCSSQALSQWKRKFLAGQNVNRRFRALAKSSPRTLPVQPGRDQGFHCRLLSFDREETVAIYDRAYREAGYLMESAFFLAVIVGTLQEQFSARWDEGVSYLVPVTTDLRNGKDPAQELFFNHVSYLFYQVPPPEGGELKVAISSVKQQLFEQVKSGFARDLAEASLLTRIAPVGLLGRMLAASNRKTASFVYTHLGKSAFLSEELLGSPVENIFHLPRVPVPPGLGFFASDCRGRLNLIISHLDGMFSDGELELLESGIRAGLGAPRP